MSEQDATLDEFIQPSDSDSQDTTWEEQQLKELVKQLQAGGTPDTDKDEYYGGDIPWVKTGELGQLKIDSTEQTITEQGLEESTARLFPSKTVLIAMYGATTGEVSMLDTEATTNQACCGIIPIDRLLPHYLYYQLVHGKKQLESLSAGSGQQNISKSILEKFRIPVAPLDEQRKIASILYNIDQAIQKTSEIVDQIHQIKSGLMQDVFHGKHERNQRYRSTPVGEIPPHWEVTSIGDVVQTAQYGISESMSEEGQYPIFRMNNIENGYMVEEPMKYIDLDDDEFEKYRVKEGDILFNRTNSLELVGKTGIYELEGDHVFASYLVRLQANERVAPYYLNYYMNSSEAQNRMMDFATKGVSQANINANSIQQVQLPLPPLEEQKKIVEQIQSLDDQIESNEQYKSQLKRLKQGLMQDLLSGTIRTTDTNIEVLDEVAQHG